jgi:hypothetical protein
MWEEEQETSKLRGKSLSGESCNK